MSGTAYYDQPQVSADGHALQAADMTDPFTSPTAGGPNHHRYSTFDNQLFSSGAGASPGQAKRVLEAHLAETERRIEEASKLGTSLVEQRQELAARLEEVEQQQTDSEITPELKKKLTEIEREYNEVGRETARAFLPKSRVPSNELGTGSPFTERKRSVSPSKFESQATGSPTKLSVPNRKQRNQPSNRVHDIEFATEISTSLLSQIRHLQGLLSEKEDALRTVTYEKGQLEDEFDATRKRLESLDESEQRYKDENWNLETQLQEQVASAKDAANREQKLSQTLSLLQAEKTAAQKELDEIKLTHAKLLEEHTSAVKHHDTELGSVKRSMTMAETERGALQRKVEELVSQNQELAKAMMATQRAHQEDQDQGKGASDEDFQTADDNQTPENSPPPSPVKATPRHSMLESETLKSSLHHAHRMIQNLKSNIHREKTEKLELKRLLQDTRDELEIRRNDSGMGSATKRSRKVESREFKKPPRPTHLGGVRSVKSEVFLDDPSWEDHGEPSPSRGAAKLSETSDAFETAHETSDAFETANEHERGTETEDFQTGAEDLSGSDQMTETEGGGPTLRKKKPSGLSLRRVGSASSFRSTASTSAEEFGFEDDVKTPVQPQRMRLRVSRGGLRRQRMGSEEPFQSSPAQSSTRGTPQAAGQSLFAELGELNNSDDEGSYDGTPSRSVISECETPTTLPQQAPTTPSLLPTPPILKPSMVESGVMTEPWEPVKSTPESEQDSDSSLNKDLAAFPAPPSLSMVPILSSEYEPLAPKERELDPLSYTSIQSLHAEPIEPQQRVPEPLSISSIQALGTEPIEPVVPEPPAPEPLAISSIKSLHTEPISPVLPAPAALAFSTISGLHSDPIESPVEPPAPLAYSSINALHTEPIEPVLPKEPEPAPPAPLIFAPIQALHTEPIEPVLPKEPEPAPPAPPASLEFSSIQALHTEPIEPVLPAEPEPVLASLGMSSIQSLHAEPIEPPSPKIPEPAALAFSSVDGWGLEPIDPPTPTVIEPAPLNFASIQSLHSEPIEVPAEPEPVPASLALSTIQSLHAEPIEPPTPQASEPAPLAFSSFNSWGLEPVDPPAPKAPVPAPLGLANIQSLHSEPISPKKPIPDPLALSNISSIHAEPVEAPSRNLAFVAPLPGDENADRELKVGQPQTPKRVGLFSRKNKETPVTFIAEDETRQSPSDSPAAETPESQRPFKEVVNDSTARATRKAPTPMTDGGSQTSLTAEQIDRMFKEKAKRQDIIIAEDSVRPTSSASQRGRRGSHESTGSVIRVRSPTAFDPGLLSADMRRPTSRSSGLSHPPLPPDHKQAIAAAASRSHHGSGDQSHLGSMGPPPLPASILKRDSNMRPKTPTQNPLQSASTPRNGDTYSPSVAKSRRSSVTSFASEVDTRFNLRALAAGAGAEFSPGTDPRMIQAITQTMIGEYLWKYTRKTGGGLSQNRHRRFFWVHPYTRTLYWSDSDPSSTSRAQSKAKSVAIEAVRVVTDDNPMPPGLHRKSLIVMSPGRQIKFTAVTGQRHETWFNALSYLLLRTGGTAEDTEDGPAAGLTSEDIEEFNGYGRQSRASRAAPSLSSYHSRTTRNESPTRKSRVAIEPTPTLTHSASTPTRPGTLSRISNIWKPTSLKSRHSTTGRQDSIYQASEVHDSAEDLREIYEQQDRDADRLEDVRACCDGKHHVGTLHKRGGAHSSGRHSSAAHRHPSTTPTGRHSAMA